MSWPGGDPWAPPPSTGPGTGSGFLAPGLPEPPGATWLRVLLWVAGLVLLLGAPVGLLWVHLGPGIAVTDEGGERPGFPRAETKESFAVDVSFLLFTASAGAACGAVAWAARRHHGPAVPVGLAVGGLLAGVIARTVGERVVLDGAVDRVCDAERAEGIVSAYCTYFPGHLELRATAFVLAWAVTALVVHAALVAAVDRDPPEPAQAPDWWPPTVPEPYSPTR